MRIHYAEKVSLNPSLVTEKVLTVINRSGVHARPSALLIEKTKYFKGQIFIARETSPDDKINAKSIMGLICLGLHYGEKVLITIEGVEGTERADVEQLLAKITALFESGFGEN